MTAESIETRTARMEERLKAMEESMRAGFQRLEQLLGVERERTETRCAAREEVSDGMAERLAKVEAFNQEVAGFMAQVKGAWKATVIISGLVGSVAGALIAIIVQLLLALLKVNGAG